MISIEGLKDLHAFANSEAKEYYALVKNEYLLTLAETKLDIRAKIIARYQKVKDELRLLDEAEKDLEVCLFEFTETAINKGVSEEEAIALAKQALSANADTTEAKVIKAKVAKDFAKEELRKRMLLTIVACYVSSVLGILILSTVLGFLLAKYVVPNFYFECIAVCIICGLLLGTSIGLFAHAIIINKKNYKA